MSTAAERLIEARTNAGCETAAEAAERAGVKYYTYVQHESGTRGISKDKAEKYGRAFGVDPSWLLYGKGKGEVVTGAMVRIIGRVGADNGGEVIYTTGQESWDLAPVPPGGTSATVALVVSGHSMRAFADDGALVYFENQHQPPTPDMIGDVCIVETEDHRVLVKRLLKGSEAGLYDLESHNGPTLSDIRLVWAAEPTAIIPSKQARRVIRRADESQVA